VIVKCPSINP